LLLLIVVVLIVPAPQLRRYDATTGTAGFTRWWLIRVVVAVPAAVVAVERLGLVRVDRGAVPLLIFVVAVEVRVEVGLVLLPLPVAAAAGAV